MAGWKWVLAIAAYLAFGAVLVCTTHVAAAKEERAVRETEETAKAEKADADAAVATGKAVAKRPIPKGGLVMAAALDKATADDLKSLQGTYARRDLRSGDRVRTADVQTAAPLAVLPGVIWIGLPVARAEAESGRIEVGAAGAVCTARGLVAEVSVGALACADPKAPYCTAFLRVDASNMAVAGKWLESGAEVAPRCP